MKKIYLVVLGDFLLGCKKNNPLPNYSDISTGTYDGQFATRYVGADAALVYYQGMSGRVNINLSTTLYNCTSPSSQFSAAAAGRYTRIDNMISFRDSTIHPANFDWNIILTGDYQFSVKDDSLFLSKVKGPISYDYKLKKQ